MLKHVRLYLLLIFAIAIVACGSSDEPAQSATATTEPVVATDEPEPTAMPEPTEEMMDDDDMMDDMQTVGDIAMADDNFSMLVDAMLATGLDTVVQGEDPVTVFAPTNAAFEALPEGLLESLTEDQLRDILSYHVVSGRVMAADVMGMDMGTSVLGEDFDVTVDGDTVMINDATITSADIEGSNGIIHVIDSVLIPPSMADAVADMMMDDDMMDDDEMMDDMQTVGDIAMADDSFSILVDAVLATGLDTVVQGEDPVTVFAPTNAAFEALPEGLLESLTEDQLRDILSYHVVSGRVMAADVMGMDMGTSVLGEDFDVTVDGETVMINDATIISADIEGSNGIIHVIDSVLIPPSMADAVADMMMDDDMMDDDMMGEMMMPAAIYATSNPSDLANDAVVALSPDLMETLITFGDFSEDVTSVESIYVTSNGTAYLTMDTGEGSGALVGIADFGSMGEEMMMSDDDMMEDDAEMEDDDEMMDDGEMMSDMMMSDMEMMMGSGLTAPKGLHVAERAGVILVADFGANSIVIFDMELNQVATTTDLGGERSVWDIYHDADSDTLFATGTDGVLLVYEGYAENGGDMAPTRMITPTDADGNKISVNLHGIAYYAANDEVILTDVGDAASAEDGQLFVIPNALSADGDTPVSVQIGGPESMLGNPVDVVFDGSHAYVAEKSNDMVLRFDDLTSMDMMGMMGDQAPAAMIEVVKAESVALPAASMMMDGGMMDDGMMDDGEMMDEDESMDDEESADDENSDG